MPTFLQLQFLTIVPLPVTVRCEEEDLGRSMSFFPLVGLAIGALLAGADFLLAPLLPRGVADLVLVALLSLVTGGLHLDGLSDVCDGLAARGSRQRFLDVMKDSRVGAVGAVALVLGLMLKYQALLAVPPEYKREALLFFPLAARFAQVQMTVGIPRPGGVVPDQRRLDLLDRNLHLPPTRTDPGRRVLRHPADDLGRGLRLGGVERGRDLGVQRSGQ